MGNPPVSLERKNGFYSGLTYSKHRTARPSARTTSLVGEVGTSGDVGGPVPSKSGCPVLVANEMSGFKVVPSPFGLGGVHSKLQLQSFPFPVLSCVEQHGSYNDGSYSVGE
jgi:hypothetical protein